MSAINNVTNYVAATAVDAYKKTDTTSKATDKEKTTTEGFSEEAAVYEKSSDTSKDAVTSVKEKKAADHEAIVKQLQADMETQKSRLMEIVKNSISGQGKAFALATFDENSENSIWKILASGDFTVDAETKAQAQADIAEGGYWSVEETANRILDFAKALSGGDTSKAETLIDAFKKGFAQATKAWGQDLPDISKNTYDAVLEKFNQWKLSESEKTESTNSTVK